MKTSQFKCPVFPFIFHVSTEDARVKTLAQCATNAETYHIWLQFKQKCPSTMTIAHEILHAIFFIERQVSDDERLSEETFCYLFEELCGIVKHIVSRHCK